jgi:hypothetical protein
VAATVGLLAIPAQALTSDFVLTYAEAPSATNSTLADTSVFDFNSLTPATHLTNVNWSGVGTYSQLYVINGNEYGGAAGSRYSVESAKSSLGSTPTVTLTMNSPVAYFGMWWSAGDSNNFLSFYSDGNLLASFSTATLLSKLPAAYFGNPTPGYKGMDTTEAFAFINFFGQAGTTFDEIVFSDPSTTSGFESDNHTVRATAYGLDPKDTGPLPGVPVEEIVSTNGIQTIITDPTRLAQDSQAAPEPSELSLIGLGLVVVAWLVFWKKPEPRVSQPLPKDSGKT